MTPPGKRACAAADGFRLPHQLDLAVLCHDTGGKQVMERAPGRPHRRVGHVFGEHLLRRVDQDMGFLGLEGEVQIVPGELGLQVADCVATSVPPGDAHRIQERRFNRPVLGEQGGGILAVRDSGEKFEQQSFRVFHRDGIFAVER